MDWRCDSSGIAPALQAQSLNPSSTTKKKKKKEREKKKNCLLYRFKNLSCILKKNKIKRTSSQ
jgi:hypothetical protein